ncbi:MAG: hypothetical protein ACK5PP_13835 [Acidimicrobiales bacterium]
MDRIVDRPRRRTRRRFAPVMAILILLALAGCAAIGPAPGGDGADVSEDVPDVTPAAPPATSPGPAEAPGAGPVGAAPAGPDLCADLVVTSPGPVGPPAREVSGAGAVTGRPGAVWLVNDSGSATELIAEDGDGTVAGVVDVDGVDPVDIEDLAVVDGMVYLADIGDNGGTRSTIAVHRVPEPSPDDTGTGPAETLRFRYPDGPHDAEALLVDPVTHQVVIIPKIVGLGDGDSGRLLGASPAPVYVADLPAAGTTPTEPVELRRAGTVPLDELDAATTAPGPTEGRVAELGAPGVATGADISADGSRLAVRTYRTVWLFPRTAGASVADALAGPACEAPTAVENQGEAVAFMDGAGPGFVTVGEGESPRLNLTAPG